MKKLYASIWDVSPRLNVNGFLFLILLLAGTSMPVFSQTVTGVPIVSFDFSSATGTETTYASSFNNSTYVNASSISKGPGLQAGANATTGQNFLTAGYFVSTNWTGTTETNAITNGTYYQFTISPKSGYEFRIDSLILLWRSAGAGVTGVTLRSSQDAYGAVKATGTVAANSSGTLKLTLTSAITSDTAITLRIYGFGASSGKNFGYGQNPTNATTPDINVYGQMTTANIPAAVLSNGSGSSTICLGAGAFIKVAITGGTAPFTIWTTDNLGLKRSFTQNGTNDSIQVFPQTTKTYTLDSVKDAMSHKATALSGSATVTVSNSPIVTNTGTYARTLAHNDGLTLTYADGNLCKSWITISDAAGGTNPGSTTCTANVLNAIPINTTSRYFVPRHLRVQPTTDGNATVTLFYSQAEFNSFNTSALYHNKLPATPTDTAGVKTKLIVRRTQSSTETASLTSFTPTSVTWNATNSQWEVTISVNDGVLGGYYYVSTPFNSSKMVGTISHTAVTPVSGNTSAIVNIDWPDVSGVTQYRFRYRKVGESIWNVSTVTGSLRMLDYLLFNTSYELQIRVFESGLGAYVQGEYSGVYNFTTPQEPSKLPGCSLPNNISAVANSPVAATVSWTAANYAANYVIETRVQNTLSWGGTSAANNSVVLNYLNPNTTYEYRIRTTCVTGYTETGTSIFSSIGTFTTPALNECGSLSNVNVSNISANGAIIKWSPVNYATSYQIQTRVKNTATWGGTTRVDTSYTLSNLSPSTAYEYRIRALCNGTPMVTTNNSGAFTSVNEFTTSAAQVLAACMPPTNIQALPTSNSIVVSWDSAAYGPQYFINIKQASASTWGGTTVTGFSRTFTGLAPATDYHIRIRTMCTPGTTLTSTSVFSDTIVVATSALANKAVAGNMASSINVYPNPVNDVLHVDYGSMSNEQVRITLYDVAGRIVFAHDAIPMIGENNMDIPLASLQNGFYVIRIQQSGMLRFSGSVHKINR